MSADLLAGGAAALVLLATALAYLRARSRSRAAQTRRLVDRLRSYQADAGAWGQR